VGSGESELLAMGRAIPDVMVATIMAGLALQGAWVVLNQSLAERRISTSPTPAA
jgi:hypothetical protein